MIPQAKKTADSCRGKTAQKEWGIKSDWEQKRRRQKLSYAL